MKNIIKKGLMAVSASLLLLAASGTAHAVAPANSTLTNTASLSYAGLATPITASVDIAVTLKVTTPNISTAAPITVLQGTAAQVPYTLTTTSNGPETFNLTGTNTPTNTAGTSAAPVYQDALGNVITSVTVGATAPNADFPIGATTLTVPSDGTPDGQVNGIAANDTVVIAGVTYTVASVVDNPTGGSTITLASPLTVAAPTGTLIAEQASFTMVVPTVGTILNAANPASVLVATTATSATVPAIAAGPTNVTITLTSVTFEKFVRNVTTPNGVAAAPGSSITVGVATYYATSAGVTATTGDVLEYYLKVTVPAGGGALTGATLTDTPPAFTTYVAGSTFLNASAVATPDAIVGGVAQSALVAGMQVNDPASVAGTVAAGTSAAVTFQVTVD